MPPPPDAVPPNNDLPPVGLLQRYRDDWHIAKESGGKKYAVRYPPRTVPPVLIADSWEELERVLEAWEAGHQ